VSARVRESLARGELTAPKSNRSSRSVPLATRRRRSGAGPMSPGPPASLRA